MSLFDKLKDTKLKSLKFGEKGTAGDSTKPYIVTDINTVDTPFNKLRLTKFDDGLIRGGAIGAINASAVDTLRIGKFLTDFPKGPLFIAKQVGLQLANPPLETKQMPTDRVGNGLFGKIVAGAINVANKLNNLVGGPTRIYNLGINTLAQVPVNAFGGHIARHGFLPYLNESQKYIKVVYENNKGTDSPNNRLIGLRNKLFKPIFGNKTDVQANEKSIISDNFGGAKSVYGIGRTTIHRTTFTGDQFNIAASLEKSKTTSRAIRTNILNYVDKPNTIYQKYKLKDPLAFLIIDKFRSTPVTASIDTSALETNYGKIVVKPEQTKPKFNIFASSENAKPLGTNLTSSADGQVSLSKSFNKTTSDKTLNLTEPTSSFITRKAKYDAEFKPLYTQLKDQPDGEPNEPPAGHINRTIVKYTPSGSFVDGFDRPFADTRDVTYNRLINQARVAEIPTLKITNEIVKEGQTKSVFFKFNKLDTQGNVITSNVTNALEKIYERIDKNIMRVEFSQLNPFTATPLAESIFSAYMSGYNENYDSGWDNIKYNGRSEYFYTFNSFKKTASFKLQIPIFNPGELATKHEALKNLQKSAAGAYLNNRLGGVITKIKLGHYLNYTPCIITNLKITIPNDVSWDWGINNADGVNQAYAMLLEADFSITVIGNEIPGWDLGKTTPDTPQLPEDVVTPPKTTPPKTNTLKIAITPVQTIRTDNALSEFTPDTFGNRTYGGTSAVTAAKSKQLVQDPVKQKALADALNKPKAVNK